MDYRHAMLYFPTRPEPEQTYYEHRVMGIVERVPIVPADQPYDGEAEA